MLKTYDPISGVCLKYRTDKAAEVGRLVAALGSCGRVMAGVPEREKRAEDISVAGGGEEQHVAGSGEGVGQQVEREKEKGKGSGGGGGGAGAGGGGGGGGKKRKGKR